MPAGRTSLQASSRTGLPTPRVGQAFAIFAISSRKPNCNLYRIRLQTAIGGSCESVRGSDAAFKTRPRRGPSRFACRHQGTTPTRLPYYSRGRTIQRKKVTVPNILLFGPPGTGKTTLPERLPTRGHQVLHCHYRRYEGAVRRQSAHLVRSVFSKSRRAPAVLFIDD
jgi:hypothetical protein